MNALIKKNAHAVSLTSIREYQDKLLDAIGDSSVVLIGESSHGTHDFYFHRAELTKRLIKEKGFNIVAVEADFPDCLRVTKYIRGEDGCKDRDAKEALGDFERFPRWMWRNNVVQHFLEWLKLHNNSLNVLPQQKVGFYGLDLYSLHASRDAVVKYLQSVDKEVAKRALQAFSCFDRFGKGSRFDSGSYAATGLGLTKSCEREVQQVVMELNTRTQELLMKDPSVSNYDQLFCANMNAKIVKDAEEYYRHMFIGGKATTWNIRDEHMYFTLRQLMKHYTEMNKVRGKAVIWAHNSHVGDASTTEVASIGELNIGQLARQNFGKKDSFIVGFSTYSGTVTAANDWDEPPKVFQVKPGMKGSYEELFHNAAVENRLHDYMLLFKNNNPETPLQYVADPQLVAELAKTRLERAIGVVYRPSTERQSHYMKCSLSSQFDGLIYLDKTKALRPLELGPQIHTTDEFDETFPFGV